MHPQNSTEAIALTALSELAQDARRSATRVAFATLSALSADARQAIEQPLAA